MSAIKSYIYIESCPNVIQQAVVCRSPIVATEFLVGTSDIPEGGKWGCLVPVGNPQAKADVIIAAVQDKINPDGRIQAADFDPKQNAKEYLKLLLPDFFSYPTPTVVL